MEHSPGFLKLVNAARVQVKEVSVAEALERLKANPQAALVDVREDREWERDHAAQAIHLGRGVLERDLEQTIPDRRREIIFYCGGGYRSALAAESVKKMGYENVASLAGGYKAMVASGWPMKKE